MNCRRHCRAEEERHAREAAALLQCTFSPNVNRRPISATQRNRRVDHAGKFELTSQPGAQEPIQALSIPALNTIEQTITDENPLAGRSASSLTSPGEIPLKNSGAGSLTIPGGNPLRNSDAGSVMSPGENPLRSSSASSITSPGESPLTSSGAGSVTSPGESSLITPGESPLTSPGASSLTSPGSSPLTGSSASSLATPTGDRKEGFANSEAASSVRNRAEEGSGSSILSVGDWERAAVKGQVPHRSGGRQASTAHIKRGFVAVGPVHDRLYAAALASRQRHRAAVRKVQQVNPADCACDCISALVSSTQLQAHVFQRIIS